MSKNKLILIVNKNYSILGNLWVEMKYLTLANGTMLNKLIQIIKNLPGDLPNNQYSQVTRKSKKAHT